MLEYLDEKESSWKRNSLAAIKSFLDFTYEVNRDDKPDYEHLAGKYLTDKRDPHKDLIAWKKAGGTHHKKKMSPKTLRLYLSALKEFFDVNDIKITAEQKKKLVKEFKGGNPAPVDAPDQSMIHSFIEHADVRLKAITLVLASTGMRIGEVLALRDEMFDPDRRMITLPADVTKTDSGRNVFYNKETEKALNEWLKKKTKYIEDNNKFIVYGFGKKKEYNRVAVDDGRIFPFDQMTINRAWNKTLKKSNLLKKNSYGHVTFHPHALRKYFSVQLRLAKMPEIVVEALLGHDGYLSMYNVKAISPKELQAAYEEYAGILSIESMGNVHKVIKELTEKSTETNGKMQTIELENKKLKEKLIALESNNEVERLKKEIATIQKWLETLSGKYQEATKHETDEA